MIFCDETQRVLHKYLLGTEVLMNELLTKSFSGSAKIRVSTDLGFPHDIIRIAGGFATGVYVSWSSNRPFVPIDTCVNVCSVSYFEITKDIRDFFTDDYMNLVKSRLSKGIYISNFHRGNHFIAYVKSQITGKLYLVLHSSANEFKDNFNGLYPVPGNWYFDRIKTYSNGRSYIRYIENKDAEMFYKMAEGLYKFNEIRHEFVGNEILQGLQDVVNIQHFHHYGMPSLNSVVMGSHILKNDMVAPILAIPGKNIYMVKFKRVKDESLLINKNEFLTPHGWGKRDKSVPQIFLNLTANEFSLDGETYEIKFGSSLRNHPNLVLRDFLRDSVCRKKCFFEYLNKIYDLEVVDEMKQIVSWNKDGIKIW